MKKKPNVELKVGSSQSKVLAVLNDNNWHCRGCEYKNVPSGQLAGGGGIKGLKNGSLNRQGYQIKTERRECPTCDKKTVFDRWTGRRLRAVVPAGMPKKLARKIYKQNNYHDVIEQRKRPGHELVIDHRFPKIRWGKSEEPMSLDMPPADMEQKFQILKKDGGGNHNLLKSRACEECFKTKMRGKPLGICFFYEGNENWPDRVPQTGPGAEKGCVGCGWYDFKKWRAALNVKLAAPSIA